LSQIGLVKVDFGQLLKQNLTEIKFESLVNFGNFTFLKPFIN
jgi:hypothetical protein